MTEKATMENSKQQPSKKTLKKPLWDVTSRHPTLPELTKNLTTEICIIGAGITGLSLAYILSAQGKKVIIIDKGEVGFGETGVTTAHLTQVLDDRYTELVSMHGKVKIRALLESHIDAINTIEDIVKREKIDCEFQRVDGYLFLGKKDTPETLEQELDMAHRLGYTRVEQVKHGPVGTDIGVCLKFPDQAQFHPLKYLNGLASIVLKNGGEIYVNSFVRNLEEVENGVRVELENGHTVQAQNVIMATNAPFMDKESMIYAKQAAYRTYAIGLEVPRGSVANALSWDTDIPYHYIRMYTFKDEHAQAHEFLMVGGEDHKTGQQKEQSDPHNNLLRWAREKFPMVQENTIYTWSGQVLEPTDRLAFIGRNPGNKYVFVATGFSGSGMTYGVIAAKIITDLINGKKNALSEIYSPARSMLKGAMRFMKENANVGIEYVGNLLSQKQPNIDDLSNGSGVVTGKGKEKTAVYKDAHGKIRKLSAVCPHRGCAVGWNSIEGTWDCPCHGSRFDAHGKVINGPARGHLKQIE